MNTKQNAFNPSLYDFLDDASIVTWVEEFIKRNQDFQTNYKELNRLAISKKREDHIKFIKLSESMTERYGFMPHVEQIYLRPDVKMDTYGPVALSRQAIMAHEKTSKVVWDSMRPNGIRDDRLMISVDLMYTDEEIINCLNDILYKKRNHMPRRMTRKRVSEWKLYLMVFDLKTEDPKRTYVDISIILTDCEIEKAYDMKNVENYHHKAIKLIQDGYKKFLP